MKKLKEALLDFNLNVQERTSAAKKYTKVLEEWEKEHIELGSSIAKDLSSKRENYFLFQKPSELHRFVYLEEFRGWDNHLSIPVELEHISSDGWVDLRIGTKISYFTRSVPISIFIEMLEHMVLDDRMILERRRKDGTVY